MSHILDTFRLPLADLKVLVVEDDAELAIRIAALLRQATGLEPAIAHSVEYTLSRLVDEQFDLATIDVMLPMTEADLIDIGGLEKKVHDLGNQIAELKRWEADPQVRERLRGIQLERAMARKKIDDLIDPEGGITLIERWKECHGDDPWPLPTVFLTAISNDAVKIKGQRVAGEKSRWLVKPMSSEDILTTCAELVAGSGSGRRG